MKTKRNIIKQVESYIIEFETESPFGNIPMKDYFMQMMQGIHSGEFNYELCDSKHRAMQLPTKEIAVAYAEAAMKYFETPRKLRDTKVYKYNIIKLTKTEEYV